MPGRSQHPGTGADRAFQDANNASMLVRDVKSNSLAKGLWMEYERVTCEIIGMARGNA